jgi:nanoRNase/pAp phosphatase (c-di-AMP/oligoRNAs hydrolase)
MHYDVFNGDADGIIALLQLRLAGPKESILVTGVKRDIGLLKQVAFENENQVSSVTVLDISLEKNIEGLTSLLDDGVSVFYVDHHRTGDIPQSPNFTSLFDTDANVCTSLLVNQHLNNQFAYWAIAAAFGDNMQASARTLANQYGLSDEEQTQLNELGVYINYNGYGSSIADLHFHPADLFKSLLNYPNPFDLIHEPNSIFAQLKKAYLADMEKAKSAEVLVENTTIKAVLLDDAPWARRVSGVFGNELANISPDRAHAVLTLNKSELATDKSYTVSLRAPLNNKQGAGDICAKFPTGGGRAAAAGVNVLDENRVSDFFNSVSKYYQ